MSLSTNTIITIEDVNIAYFINSNGTQPSSSSVTDKLEQLINSKSTQIAKYLGMENLNATSTTEYYDGDGSNKLFLKQFPVNSITSIYDDTDWQWEAQDLISSSDYRIVGHKYVVLKDGCFMNGTQNVKITYNAGWVIIPEDIKRVCIEEVIFAYEMATKHLIGMSSRNIANDGSVQIFESGLMASTKQVLNKYKSVMVV